jgi:hypothetical protein
MKRGKFIVPYTKHSALHCTQEISFNPFSYCTECSFVLNRTNEMHGRQQVAFLCYCYVKKLFVFVQVLEISCKFLKSRHHKTCGIHTVDVLKLLESNILVSVGESYPYNTD